MSLKENPKWRNPVQRRARNEAVVLLSSASGRTVGFIIDIGRRGIPFGQPAAERYSDKDNMLDTLMDGSFLPFDIGTHSEIENREFSDIFYSLENRLRRSLRVNDLSNNHLSELAFLMQHITLMEN